MGSCDRRSDLSCDRVRHPHYLAAPSDSCGGTLEAFINNEPTGVCVVCVCGLVAVMLVLLLQDKCRIVGVTCDRILKRLHTQKLSHTLIVVAARTFSC